MFVSQRVEDPNQGDMTLLAEDVDGNDMAQSLLNIPDYHFFVIAYDLDNTNQKAFQKLESLFQKINDAGYSFICLTSTMPDDISAFKERSGIMFDFYNSDDVVLKAMIRSNPGLILLKDGKVLEKWHYNDFPEWEYLKEKFQLRVIE